MNLIDSSVWLEYFAAGPQAGQFAAAIERIDEVLVPTWHTTSQPSQRQA